MNMINISEDFENLSLLINREERLSSHICNYQKIIYFIFSFYLWLLIIFSKL